MDCLNPQQSNKHKLPPIFVSTVNIKALCGKAFLLRKNVSPQKKMFVWASPEAATHHPAVTWPLPSVAPTASSLDPPQRYPFPQQARPCLLGRHWLPFLQKILPSVASEVTVIHFFRKAAPVTCAGTWGHLLNRALPAILWLRQCSSPQRAWTALSRPWHPSPQLSTGYHLLSEMQALISSGRAHSLSLWCQALPNSPSGDQQGAGPAADPQVPGCPCRVHCVSVPVGSAAGTAKGRDSQCFLEFLLPWQTAGW